MAASSIAPHADDVRTQSGVQEAQTPSFLISLTPAANDAVAALDPDHSATVFARLKRIAELATYGNLRGRGRFTVDSIDLLSSLDLVFEVEEPRRCVLVKTPHG